MHVTTLKFKKKFKKLALLNLHAYSWKRAVHFLFENESSIKSLFLELFFELWKENIFI